VDLWRPTFPGCCAGNTMGRYLASAKRRQLGNVVGPRGCSTLERDARNRIPSSHSDSPRLFRDGAIRDRVAEWLCAWALQARRRWFDSSPGLGGGIVFGGTVPPRLFTTFSESRIDSFNAKVAFYRTYHGNANSIRRQVKEGRPEGRPPLYPAPPWRVTPWWIRRCC